MSRKVILKAPKARLDLEDCYTYIGERNPEAAQRFRQAAEMTFDLLADMPNAGVIYKVRDIRMKGLRQFPIKHFAKYLVFYVAVDESIKIIRVLHSARNLRAIMSYDA